VGVTTCLFGTTSSAAGRTRELSCWTDYEDNGSPDGGALGDHGGPNEGGGGGSINNDNPGDHTDVTDASQGDKPCADGPNPAKANPIVISTGNKIEHETDFASAGEMPLTLERTYDHFWKYVGLFGKHWVSSFDYSLVWQNNEALIFAQRPDGRRIKFTRLAGNPNRWNEDKPSPVAYIVKNADGTYTHTTEGNGSETYDGGGKPLTIRNAHGIGWTFAYTNNYPTKITHTSGRFVQLTWTSGKLTSVTDPAGAVFTYTYTANAFAPGVHRLASTIYPSAAGDPATTIAYYYEDARYPGALTGKAYNGVRYSTFAYDDKMRAIKSEHMPSGVDRFTYVYNGTPVPPPLSPPDPPPPGSNCNPVTHQCPAAPIINDADSDADAGETDGTANAALSANEDALIASVGATNSVVETNPLGLKTTYTFLDGKLDAVSGTATTFCAARSKSRSYDANGNEDLVTDFNGNYTDYNYNAKGQLTQKVEAYNTAVARTTTYVWDATWNRVVSETVAGDHLTSYTYSADQRIATITVKNLASTGVLNQTHVWTFTYTKYASGLLHTMIVDGPLPGNDKITYTYSAAGDLASVTNSHGHTTTWSLYDNRGFAGRMLGPNGDQTDYAYYPDGRLSQVTTHPNAVAAATHLTYAAGLPATVKTPDNVTTSYVYDAARRITKESRNELNGTAERRIGYDVASDPTKIEIYRGAAQRYLAYIDYDEAGRVRARRGNHNQNVRYAYDSNDNVKTVTDSLSHVTKLAYDGLNRLSTATDAKNGVTKYEYDKGDRVTKVTDPKNLATIYAYDGFGQLWKEVSPDRGTTSFAYTASGLRSSMTRATNVATTYGYDDIGRLLTIAAGGKTQTFAYDTCTNGKGRICTIADPAATTTYTYTKEGLVASQYSNYAPAHGGWTSWSYTYDAMGRPLTLNDVGSAQQQQFTYTSGQLSAIKYKIGNAAAVNVATAFTYEPMGPLTGFTYGNGLARTRVYDLDRRPTSIAVPGVQSLSYAYNANDAITTQTNGINATLSQTYGYDELMRLTSVTSGSGNEGFTYDANGNRLTHTTAQGAAALTYTAGKNRLATWSRAGSATRSYDYDAAGNTTSLLGKTYTYDPFNRLSKVSGGGITATYEVNALGERTYKNSNGTESFYVYGPDHTLLGDYTRYSTGWNDIVRVSGEPVAVTRNNILYFIHSDHLGRPEAITNASKTVVWRAKNLAFDRSVATDTFGGFNLGFSGQYFDQETGNWYNLGRDYDSVIGRYLQFDPAGLSVGPNPYTYVGNTPTIWADPTGRNAVLTAELGAEGGFAACGPVCGAVGGAIGFGIGVLATTEAINHLNEAKDGSASKPSECPTGTLPINEAKGKFGLSHDDAETIKHGVRGKSTTWTGIAPNGDVWVGTSDGKGTNEGPFGTYLPGG
jgi:RHS repeat-associated protein